MVSPGSPMTRLTRSGVLLELEWRAREHDDVAPVDAVEVVAEFVDDDPVAHLEGGDIESDGMENDWTT